MPMTSASSLNVNVQLSAVSGAIDYFNQQQKKVEPLKAALNNQQGGLERDFTGLTGASRRTAEGLINSIAQTRDTNLKRVEENIQAYLSQATQGLEKIQGIEVELGKGKLSRRGQKSGSTLVAEAQKICEEIRASEQKAKDSRGAIGGGSIVNGLGAIQDSVNLFGRQIRDSGL